MTQRKSCSFCQVIDFLPVFASESLMVVSLLAT